MLFMKYDAKGTTNHYKANAIKQADSEGRTELSKLQKSLTLKIALF